MLPTLEFNVLAKETSLQTLVRDKETDVPITSLSLVVKDRRPVRIRFLEREETSEVGPTLKFVDFGTDKTISLSGKLENALTPADSFLFLANEFTRVEITDGGETTDVYYEGTLNLNTQAARDAFSGDRSHAVITEIELAEAGSPSSQVTLLQIDTTLWRDVNTGGESAPASGDPDFLNEQETIDLIEKGELDAVFSTLIVTEPGILSLDEAVAEISGNTLAVPNPNKGNILLVRRGDASNSIDDFTGLNPGTLYWLKHDDGATDPIRFDNYFIKENGSPLPIRATSETTALPVIRHGYALGFGGDVTVSSGNPNLTANAPADGPTDTGSGLAAERHKHIAPYDSIINRVTLHTENAFTAGNEAQLKVRVNGTEVASFTTGTGTKEHAFASSIVISQGDIVEVRIVANGEVPGNSLAILHAS